MVYFTEQRRFEITNLVHRKLWDHRNTAVPIDFFTVPSAILDMQPCTHKNEAGVDSC